MEKWEFGLFKLQMEEYPEGIRYSYSLEFDFAEENLASCTDPGIFNERTFL
jgi:hypothetical protein